MDLLERENDRAMMMFLHGGEDDGTERCRSKEKRKQQTFKNGTRQLALATFFHQVTSTRNMINNSKHLGRRAGQKVRK